MHLKAMSLTALERLTGIQRTAISRILNGSSISENTIRRFAIGLGVSKSEAYRQIEEARRERIKRKELTP